MIFSLPVSSMSFGSFWLYLKVRRRLDRRLPLARWGQPPASSPFFYPQGEARPGMVKQ